MSVAFSLRRRWMHFGLLTAALGWSPTAWADVDRCVAAHSHGQVLRDEGKLTQAAAELLVCASDDACPGPVREECEQYLETVRRLTPTLVFASRDHVGRDIDGVRIYMDDALVEWTSGDAPIAVDAGPHLFRFEHPDGQIIEQKLDAVQGEKARLVVAEFSNTDVLAGNSTLVDPVADVNQPTDMRRILTYTFGGLAVVGLASFAILGLQGRSEESDLRASCAPNCTSAQKQSVAQKYVWADVSLAVAGLSVAGGAVLYLAPLGNDNTTAAVSFRGEF